MQPPSTYDDVASLVRDAAERHGERVALLHKGRRWTFEELSATIEEAAVRIASVARPGARVAVVAHNSDLTALALLAAMRAGVIAVPLHPETPKPRLRAILDDCDPALVLVEEKEETAAALHPRHVDDLAAVVRYCRRSRVASALPLPAADDVAAIFYTSGSTRTPRGVVCRHRQMTFCTRAIGGVIGNRPDDVILSALPLSFDYGFYQVLLAIAAGARLIVAGQLAVATTLATIIAQERVTGLPLVPSMVGALLHSRVLKRGNFASLRYITSTGDVLPPAHIAALREELPQLTVIPMYGLTECKRVAILPPGMLDGRERSVGLPLPGTTVRIVLEDGRPADIGEVGELCVRGPHLTDGYWQDPQSTAQRFGVDPETHERELRTGDLFTRDADGFLYFVSRADTVIKSHGERIGAGEVESVINECGGVAEACVVGVPAGVAGEAIVAFAVGDAGAVDADQLQAHCAAYLTAAAQPVRFVISSDPLPRTPNGKIDRRLLRESAQHLLTVA